MTHLFALAERIAPCLLRQARDSKCCSSCCATESCPVSHLQASRRRPGARVALKFGRQGRCGSAAPPHTCRARITRISTQAIEGTETGLVTLCPCAVFTAAVLRTHRSFLTRLMSLLDWRDDLTLLWTLRTIHLTSGCCNGCGVRVSLRVHGVCCVWPSAARCPADAAIMRWTDDRTLTFHVSSDAWIEFGFQRADPSTDFRAGGTLSLECLGAAPSTAHAFCL